VAPTSFGAGNVTWCKVGHALFDGGLSPLASLVFVLAEAPTSYRNPSSENVCKVSSNVECLWMREDFLVCTVAYCAQLVYNLDRH
jgi:hypothetical protein